MSQYHNMLKAYNLLFYFTGSMILHEPSEECVVDFWEKGLLKNLPVSSSNPNFAKASSQLRESYNNKAAFGKLLHEDYLRLFSDTASALAPAFESRYVKKASGKINGDIPDVTEFYNSYGWKSRYKGVINDDHLGIELLFLTILIDKYMSIDDEVCNIEMRNEIKRFIKMHILSWVPEWNRALQGNASTLSFRGIGNMILACAEDVLSILQAQAEETSRNGSLKN